MNPSIKKLAETAEKPSRKIIGLMSGTSLDGLDIALCSVSGSGENTSVKLEAFRTIPYDESDRDLLRRVSSVETVKLSDVCYQHTRLGVLHAEMILDTLNEWDLAPDEIDCIGSHGQTIYHLPMRDHEEDDMGINTTLQIGDGDQIAMITGIMTISDFRQKHTASGGEGAPMAALVDRILFADDVETRILLNIGGIGNFTRMPAKNKPTQSFTTDTGPGNTLIDNAMQARFGESFDRDGEKARAGTVHDELLDSLLADSWFGNVDSKSTGPEYFNLEWVESRAQSAGLNTEEISGEDLVATLTELSAVTIAGSIRAHSEKAAGEVIFASGGGAHNPALIERIEHHLGQSVRNFSELGLDPDAKEAVIFAVLANETLAGTGFPVDIGNDYRIHVNFGKISFPE
jgi:anhydro-N-acetylmuramic acid kinase